MVGRSNAVSRENCKGQDVSLGKSSYGSAGSKPRPAASHRSLTEQTSDAKPGATATLAEVRASVVATKPGSITRWSEGRQEGRCGMSKPKKTKYTPVTVPFAATPAGETPGIAQWAHRVVWTDRMLATLETGVKGGRWHTLIDKVFDALNLYAAARKVLGKAGAAGVDRQTVEDFDEHSSAELRRLHQQLREDGYRPESVRRVWIPKPGSSEKRPLGIPTVRTESCKRPWST